MNRPPLHLLACSVLVVLAACSSKDQPAADGASADQQAPAKAKREYLSQPLVSEIYTADPSAHLWDGKIYIYPSHDIDGTTPEDDLGAHFEMRDYRILSRSEERRVGKECRSRWSPYH